MANKSKYNLRHIRCNMADFNADCHRFRFEYDGCEYIASCYGNSSIFFSNEELPQSVKNEVTVMVYHKIDKEEYKWRYPAEAYRIADSYVKEEFSA